MEVLSDFVCAKVNISKMTELQRCFIVSPYLTVLTVFYVTYQKMQKAEVSRWWKGVKWQSYDSENLD